MYVPGHFEQRDRTVLHGLMRAAPLATLVVAGPDGLVANHIPFVLDVEPAGTERLMAHVPRANPLSAMLATEREGIAVFHGPEGYISPSLYATKRQHGKVVPTWNYAVVHAHGPIRVVDDPAWVLAQIRALTAQREAPRAQPWAVSDAPAAFIEQLVRSLVGLELRVERLVGKTKASQNQPAENRASLLAGLQDDPAQAALYELMSTVLGEAR